jgi:hypothetical protein
MSGSGVLGAGWTYRRNHFSTSPQQQQNTNPAPSSVSTTESTARFPFPLPQHRLERGTDDRVAGGVVDRLHCEGADVVALVLDRDGTQSGVEVVSVDVPLRPAGKRKLVGKGGERGRASHGDKSRHRLVIMTSPLRLVTVSPVAEVGEWCGVGELAILLGVSRQRVQQLINSPGFPEPDFELIMGKVWATSTIRRWAMARGRQLHA